MMCLARLSPERSAPVRIGGRARAFAPTTAPPYAAACPGTASTARVSWMAGE